jgi:hypothetical protein
MFSFMTLLLTAVLAAQPGPGDPWFRITVVDEQTGRGVPLVELETVHHIRYYTDSNGIVAFHEPGLMDQDVFFFVKSHGYEYPSNASGDRGTAIRVVPGGSAVLKIKRKNIAERLYRVIGAGIYRDSVLTGQPVPIREPLLNARVLGSDSVINAIYRGRIWWFWGDTFHPAQPSGNYQVPGATSLLPAAGGLDPERGVDLTYFVDKQGLTREMAPMPGKGRTWIHGLIVLPDKMGRERLFTHYGKIENFESLEISARGLAVFDDDRQRFEHIVAIPKTSAINWEVPVQNFRKTVGGVDYLYFANPCPLTRVRADADSLKRYADYEAFTCLKQGSRLDKPELDRAADGRLRWAWKRDTPPLTPRDQDKLVQAGKLKVEESLLHLRDAESGKAILGHGGSVYWNDYRRRWVMIFSELMSTSFLGEVWYAEADTPLGPWVYARKIVTHDRQTFYNPKQHPFFDKDNGRILFFEGTYTNTFSGNPETTPTPRYEYTQILYKLDLADPRLNLPVAIYGGAGENGAGRFGTVRQMTKGQAAPVAFFALDRPGPTTVPIYAGPMGTLQIHKQGAGNAEALFHALQADARHPPATTMPLIEFVHKTSGQHAYSTDRGWASAGYDRSEKPIALVWRNPLQVILPTE